MGTPIFAGCASHSQIGRRNYESWKAKHMLRVQRRIERLEDTRRETDRVRPSIRVCFVDPEGVVSGTMVFSPDPKLCHPYLATPGYEKKTPTCWKLGQRIQKLECKFGMAGQPDTSSTRFALWMGVGSCTARWWCRAIPINASRIRRFPKRTDANASEDVPTRNAAGREPSGAQQRGMYGQLFAQ